MSDSLLDLFNSPEASRPPPPPRSRSPSYSPVGPSRRAANGSAGTRDALFLSPGSNTDSPSRRRPRPTSDDDEDDAFPRRPGVPQKHTELDLDPPLGENGQGVYVFNDDLAPLDPFAALHAPNGEAAVEGKKKRVMPKIDGDRLMGPNGFPALMREAKRFKVRGKGHETQDLKDLLNMYQIWAHNMFPKGDFRGTVMRVEKQCRTRRLESALKGYRDAFYPPPPLEAAASPGTPTRRFISPIRSPSPDGASSGRRGGSEPLFSNPGEGDEPDMDEIMAMEEMEREAIQPNGRGKAGSNDAPPDQQEEDEWEGLYD